MLYTYQKVHFDQYSTYFKAKYRNRYDLTEHSASSSCAATFLQFQNYDVTYLSLCIPFSDVTDNQRTPECNLGFL